MSDTTQVSMVQNAKSTETHTFPAVDCISAIVNGQWKEEVDKIRETFARALKQTGDLATAKKTVDGAKKNLPAVMWHGVFTRRGDKHLAQYSGLVCADVDLIGALEVAKAKARLKSDPCVFSFFTSPTGVGLKAVFRVTQDAARHRGNVEAVKQHLAKFYGLAMDEACGNLERLCFVSNDPEAFINEGAVVLPWVDVPEPELLSETGAVPKGDPRYEGRRKVAEEVLREVRWVDGRSGFCTCPGGHLHTSKDGGKDCRVYVDDNPLPTLTCFHDSCKELVTKGADRLREGIEALEAKTGPEIKEAINDLWFCAREKNYYSYNVNSGYQPYSKDDIKLRLFERGLPRGREKGESLAPVERAILEIQNSNGIDGTFPALFRSEKVVTCNGKRYLNTSRVKLLLPAGGQFAWGQGFPWVAEFLEKMLRGRLPHYLHWLAHFYRSCLREQMERGLMMFLAGPRGCGKTANTNIILEQIFGAVGEATRFLLGAEQFNGNLFGTPVWTVDDGSTNADNKSRVLFSQAVKALAANDKFNLRAMYKEENRLPWLGRLVVTMNNDPESLQMLPSTEGNILDKIMLLSTYPTFHQFPTDREVLPELPAFCAYLRDMEIDKTIWVGGRFGIAPHHEAFLLQTATDSLDSTTTREIVLTWAKEYFTADEGKGKAEWVGNPSELLERLNRDDGRRTIVAKAIPVPNVLGKHLNNVVLRGEDWVVRKGREIVLVRERLPSK